MKILYVTDLHGNVILYEQFLDKLGSEDVDIGVIGGDINPMADIHGQRFFLEDYLIRRLEYFRKKTGKPVFIMMGNDDFKVNFDVLERAEKNKVLKILHNRTHKLGKWFIAGYTYVNPTPFLLKDWEKTEKEIEKDLEKLIKRGDPKKTIYVFHTPPYNTKLDILYTGEHVGSKSLRKFIEKHKPYLTLHGHIHESPEVSGSFSQRIGKTLCVNPGSGILMKINIEDLNIKVVE